MDMTVITHLHCQLYMLCIIDNIYCQLYITYIIDNTVVLRRSCPRIIVSLCVYFKFVGSNLNDFHRRDICWN